MASPGLQVLMEHLSTLCTGVQLARLCKGDCGCRHWERAQRPELAELQVAGGNSRLPHARKLQLGIIAMEMSSSDNDGQADQRSCGSLEQLPDPTTVTNEGCKHQRRQLREDGRLLQLWRQTIRTELSNREVDCDGALVAQRGPVDSSLPQPRTLSRCCSRLVALRKQLELWVLHS